MKLKNRIVNALSGAIMTYSLATPALAEQQKDFAAKISPDGKHMVYYSYRGNALPDIFIANSDGSNERQITNTPGLWEIVPVWSPDGGQILYSAGPGMMDLEIYHLDIESGVTQQVTSGDGKGHAASWMPDGQSFFYTRMYKDGSADIHRQWLYKDKDINYTEQLPGSNLTPIVSPSGKRVAFVSDRGEGDDLDIFVADVNATTEEFTSVRQINEDDIRQDFITWSPDEKQVIYSRPDHETGKHDLYAISVASGETARLTNDPDNHHYFSSFSPDGKYLYMDIGDWDRNYFFYKAEWKSGEIKPKQVSGKGWVDTIALMEREFLTPMVGTWRGISTHGSAKGRFEEKTTYRWGPNKKSLIVDMELYWDGELYGKATGLLGLDRAQGKIYFNLTMEDGTVVMQEQQNPGVSDAWEMNAISYGNSRFYPKSMFIKYLRSKDQTGENRTWRSDIYIEENGEHKLIDVHEFTLLNRP